MKENQNVISNQEVVSQKTTINQNCSKSEIKKIPKLIQFNLSFDEKLNKNYNQQFQNYQRQLFKMDCSANKIVTVGCKNYSLEELDCQEIDEPTNNSKDKPSNEIISQYFKELSKIKKIKKDCSYIENEDPKLLLAMIDVIDYWANNSNNILMYTSNTKKLKYKLAYHLIQIVSYYCSYINQKIYNFTVFLLKKWLIDDISDWFYISISDLINQNELYIKKFGIIPLESFPCLATTQLKESEQKLSITIETIKKLLLPFELTQLINIKDREALQMLIKYNELINKNTFARVLLLNNQIESKYISDVASTQNTTPNNSCFLDISLDSEGDS